MAARHFLSHGLARRNLSSRCNSQRDAELNVRVRDKQKKKAHPVEAYACGSRTILRIARSVAKEKNLPDWQACGARIVGVGGGKTAIFRDSSIITSRRA
jgi:hypothetical protein